MQKFVSKELRRLNLISGDKISGIFDRLYSDILDDTFITPSDFIGRMWSRYEDGEPSLNGKVFEGLLACLLYRMEVLPIYLQAKLAFVPNVDFDFVLYSKEFGPVVLSAKTSLRERYKQADLEGMMLRQVHRRSKCYLLTLNQSEAANVRRKISSGEVLGLDDVILATSEDFDGLVSELSGYTYVKPPKVDVISSSKIIGE